MIEPLEVVVRQKNDQDCDTPPQILFDHHHGVSSYFTLSHLTLSGRANFYTSDATKTLSEVKYRGKNKFEDKMLVWLAFFEQYPVDDS